MYQIIFSNLMSGLDFCVAAALRCIYESNCPVQSAVPFRLNMGGNDDSCIVPYDCYCASYMISHYPVFHLDVRRCFINDNGAEMLAKYCSSEKVSNPVLEVLDLCLDDLTSVGMDYVIRILMTSEPHY